MPTIVITHDVKDVKAWASKPNMDVLQGAFAPFATDTVAYTAVDGSNRVAISTNVHDMEGMTAFYTAAFGIRFSDVDTFGITSRFGEIGGVTLKLVPMREGVDFEDFPSHQLGFVVADVEAVIALAVEHGGRQEGEILRDGDKVHAAVRDPDGNTVELYFR